MYPRLDSSCIQLSRTLLAGLTKAAGIFCHLTDPSRCDIFGSVILLCLDIPSSICNNRSQLHEQMVTGLKWFQEGPCVLFDFTFANQKGDCEVQ